MRKIKLFLLLGFLVSGALHVGADSCSAYKVCPDGPNVYCAASGDSVLCHTLSNGVSCSAYDAQGNLTFYTFKECRICELGPCGFCFCPQYP